MPKFNKKFYRLACVFVFAVGLLTCCFTLAYFSSKDAVTNRIHSKDARIILLEPKWFENGAYYANQLEPGEIINKNPFVNNDGETPVYVRMQIIVQDKDGNDITNTTRGSAILAAIRWNEGGSSLYASGASANPDYVLRTGANGEQYFYYAKNASLCTVLDITQDTSCLFDHLDIPVLKSQFNGNFDSDFTIKIVAEGLPVWINEDRNIKPETVEEVHGRFRS